MKPKDAVACEGPCLGHCYACPPWTAALAYAAMGYAIACAVYLVATRCMGTPFDDSLSDAQRGAGAEQARRTAFLVGGRRGARAAAGGS